MLDRPHRLVATMREQTATAITRSPEVDRLWLLVSVALRRAAATEFMGMSAGEVDARVTDARQSAATRLLGGDESAKHVLEFSRSRNVTMRLVDAAARRRARTN